MANIEKLSIDIPPNTLFQPITSVYKNNLTEVEFLLGVLKKLNEMIEQVNYCTDFIEKYDGEIDKLEKEFNDLVAENEQFKLNLQIDINNQLIAFRNQVNKQIETQIAGMKAYVDAQNEVLKEYIDEIALGQITLYNPATGTMEDLQSIINSMYDMDRTNGLTATEYDALELTATAYDAYDISAYDYDFNGKTILV